MNTKSHLNTRHSSSEFIIFILSFSAFSVINTEMGISGILPEITRQYGVSLGEASWLVSAFALIVAISGIFTPSYMERYNHKIVMVTVLFLFFISNIISVITNNFWILLFARIVPAFLQPAFFSLAYVVAEKLVPPSKSSQAVAKVLMGVSTGFVLGVPVSSFMASQFSLRIAMIFFMLTNLLALILVMLYVPEFRSNHSESILKQFRYLQDKKVPVSLSVVLTLNAAIFGFFSFMSVYLLKITHLPAGWVSVFLLVYGVTNIIGNFIAGKQLAINPNAFLSRVPVFIMILFLSLYIVGGYIWLVLFVFALLGIVAGTVSNSIQYVVSDSLSDSPALANGLFVSLGNVGILVGTFVDGQLIALWGLAIIPLISIIFALIGQGLLIFRSSIIRESTAQK